MRREDFNPDIHSYNLTTAKVSGGTIIAEGPTKDETNGRVTPATVVGMTPYEVKPLYNVEAAKVEEVNKINDFLRAAGVKRRFVCFNRGGKWSANEIINAAAEIGYNTADVIWAIEASGAENIPSRAADGSSLVVTLYDVYDDTDRLKIKAHGLYYRDYRANTWMVIAAKQEQEQADNIIGHFDGDSGVVYAKPDAVQLRRLYSIELEHAPIYTPNNEKDIERDLKAYAAAFAMCDKAQAGGRNDDNV